MKREFGERKRTQQKMVDRAKELKSGSCERGRGEVGGASSRKAEDWRQTEGEQQEQQGGGGGEQK